MAANGETGRETGADEILERVRALAPNFESRAEAAAKARRLPEESVREMVDAGLARILMPRARGGFGLGLETWFDAVREISKADASHGWCASLMIHHPHYVSQFSAEAQDAVWADGPDTVLAASFFPNAKVARAEGGFRLSGESPFASGIGHSAWTFIGGLVPGDPPEWRLFLVPAEDYRVSDVWFTAAMQATESNTVVTDNVFVPEALTVRMADLRDGKGPGAALHAGAIYRAPLVGYAPAAFATPMLGAAQGAYERFREWTKTRKGARGAALAEIASIQVRMARAAADLDAAELLIRRGVQGAQGPDALSLELRARTMRDYSRAGELILGAIDALIGLSGAAGFSENHPIQRAWRDIHFSATHITLNSELNFAHFGRTDLGLPRDPDQPLY